MDKRKLLLAGAGGVALLWAAWQLVVPALLLGAGLVMPAPAWCAAGAGLAVLLPLAWTWARARTAAPTSLAVEVATITAFSAAGAGAGLYLTVAPGPFELRADAALAAAGFGLALASAAAATVPSVAPARRASAASSFASLTAAPVVMVVLGGWCLLAPVMLRLAPVGLRATFATTIAVCAAGALLSAWFLAWTSGRRTGRELEEAAVSVRWLDASSLDPRAGEPPGPTSPDPELHALRSAARGLRGRLAEERDAFERTLDRSRRADAAREEFLRLVSHQLRTPLNSICGYAQLLIEGIDGPLGVEAKDSVQSILDSGRQLSALVDDVVDLAMLQSGRPGLKPVPVDLGALAREVARTQGVLVHDRPIELRVDAAADLPQVTADRKRVRQVLVNLISNALKFTDEGEVAVKLRRAGDFVEVEVADTGVGIAPRELAGIFDEYRQGTNTGSRRQKGAGLGLAICRRLIELHGGRIRAESNPGEGARFIFSLPLEPGPAGEARN